MVGVFSLLEEVEADADSEGGEEGDDAKEEICFRFAVGVDEDCEISLKGNRWVSGVNSVGTSMKYGEKS